VFGGFFFDMLMHVICPEPFTILGFDTCSGKIQYYTKNLWSISPTFYHQLFCQYFGAKKLQSQMFQLCNFWRQILAKNARLKC